MTKKSSFLLAALLLACVWTQAAGAFTIHVMMGGETESPSLIFGEAAEAKAIPFPPFSAMFGVKDVYLANPDNLGETAKVSGDLARLGTDLRVADEDNAWVLVAATDARLVLQPADEESKGETLYLTQDDAQDEEAVEVTFPYALTAKAGVNYTLRKTRSGSAITPAQDPANVLVFLDREEGETVFHGEDTQVAASGSTLTLKLVNGNTDPVTLQDLYGTFHLADGTTSDKAPETGWILQVRGGAASLDYEEDATITLAADATGVTLAALALKGGYKPISASLFNEDGQRIATVNWVILPSGTLDYDGNGEVDMDDAMYVYNLVGAGCPTPEDDWFVSADLQPFTTNATSELLQAALETLQGLPSQLDFDGSGEVDMDDAMYLYNYVGAGCPAAEDDWFVSADLQPFTTNATQERLQTALETLQSLRDQK
ncbi:MAG: hypothetical protein ACI4SG_02775 [Oligosphaeraceae bacterium]